ncbi:hypothetical protein Q31b_52690 [Novipirellula aureliae]|uniref:Uncharacterized protein n=1 Tax=Novipirellula aureliae TaxID=2527966 RepID=A0A5C6DIC6_9BACT|nr:hypothetical protein [Novipirellula aureliae]TWU35834.1 hypothetical protein Q31b_52690 [Novipirellula aureliae]
MKQDTNPYESPAEQSRPASSPPIKRGPSIPVGIGICAAITVVYWIWESRTGGNIRVDLLLFYPVLFGLYLYSLQRLGWLSAIITLLLMVANYCFFAISYSLFDLPLG